MNAQDRYNSERYLDMTCFLALRNIERNERKERRNRMKENWIYRRGDVYLANLDPYIGSEQGGTRPVVVLQNNTGNYYCPTLIVAPITSKARQEAVPAHPLLRRVHPRAGASRHGAAGAGGKSHRQAAREEVPGQDDPAADGRDGGSHRGSFLGLHVPEEMEAP